MMKIQPVHTVITGNVDTRSNILIMMEFDLPRVLKEGAICLLLHGVITRKHTSTSKYTTTRKSVMI